MIFFKFPIKKYFRTVTFAYPGGLLLMKGSRTGCRNHGSKQIGKGEITMKKNIRILAVVLGLLILITACVPSGIAGENTNVIYGMFHMKLRHNPMIAKYGVTVFFDDIEVGHVAQGEQITFGAYMREGESHVLILRSDGSDIPDHVWTIASIQNGTTFTCRI